MPSDQHAHSHDKAAEEERAKKPEARSPEAASSENYPAQSTQKARLDPEALTAGDLARLQRKIGNRAAVELVSRRLQAAALTTIQRQPEDPLTPAQVSKAIRFYRDRSAQYTEEIIRQIQSGVGMAETGAVDAEMVQAVARYQVVNAPLHIDGMAGPRTLPALFPSGLAEQASVEAYTEGAREVIEGIDWPTLSVDERADAILEKVNESLTAAGVPVVGKVVQALDPNTFGEFAFTLWSIRVNQALLANATLTADQAADLADTMYHEARHAEQWYRMAQLMAGQGRTSAEIATTMQIPNRIALIAFADPIAPDSMEALIADGWFQSVYGTGSVIRAHALGATGTDEEYRNLPEESDAWRVGSSVTEAYQAGATAAPEEAEGWEGGEW